MEDEKVEVCESCQGPIVKRKDFEGRVYSIPIENRVFRIDSENRALRDRLSRAEKIIILLRAQVKKYESR